MKLTIPEIRSRLYVLAKEHDLPELRLLANQTRRTYIKRRSPVETIPLTRERIRKIREYCKHNPRVSVRKVADLFQTGVGRVSEIIAGKR